MSEHTRSTLEQMLGAGAVLPVGTSGAGDDAVPLEARTYTHPALADRVAVRVISTELRAAEDAAAGFLGMAPSGQPTPVGIGTRQALGFPEWVLIHHPGDGHHALDVVPEMERAAQQVKTKPKKALDAYLELSARLAASVPHFLPTYFEQVGRAFLAGDNTAYAAQMFSRARRAEAEFGLAIDEERLDAAFLEFAAAGALPATQMQAYARDLVVRVPAPEALRRYHRLCVRRTAAGLVPSPQMTTSLRTLAKAAGENPKVVEAAYLEEILSLPAVLKASEGWWKAHRAGLAALARDRPAVRGTLLNLAPTMSDSEAAAAWLDLLDGVGALDGLVDPTLPAEVQPTGGAAGWMQRFLRMRGRYRSASQPMPALYALVERMADRLRAESAPAPIEVAHDVNLLDLMLSLDIAVAAPAEGAVLALSAWADGPAHRELRALSADARFHAAFSQGADQLSEDERDLRALRLLAQSTAVAPLLAAWVHQVARQSAASHLAALPLALNRIGWLPTEVLRLAAPEVRQVASTDIAAILAETFHAGILDELGWPAWDAAVAELVSRGRDLRIADAWPFLVVAGATQARVIGADGAVLTHDLRIPSGDLSGAPGFHYVDGELLVSWNSRLASGTQGYWHARSDGPRPLESSDKPRSKDMYFYAEGTYGHGLPLAGGGWTTGVRTMRAGDLVLPAEREVLSDGGSFWVVEGHGTKRTWCEFDPASGQTGRTGTPGVLSDALRPAPSGSTVVAGWVLPLYAHGSGEAAGVRGWASAKAPDGSWFGADLDGRSVSVPARFTAPIAALTFPGVERPVAVVRSGWSITLLGTDGQVLATAKTDDAPGAFAQGTAILPPSRYWHLLRPRDLQGSAALRRMNRKTAAALLEAVSVDANADADRAAVRAVLPDVSDPALLAGIAGIARFAAAEQATLDRVAARLSARLDAAPEDVDPGAPSDAVLADALNGLTGTVRRSWRRPTTDPAAFTNLRALAEAYAVRGEDSTGPAKSSWLARLKRTDPQPQAVSGYRLKESTIPLGILLDHVPALAFRAASATTCDEHRAAVAALLGEVVRLDLDTPEGTWHTMTLTAPTVVAPSGGSRTHEGDCRRILALGSAVLAVGPCSYRNDRYEFSALGYTASEALRVPAPYQVVTTSTLTAGCDAGWLRAFLGELAARGSAPWFPQAADEFAALTGVTATLARLVVAGMPQVDTYEQGFLTAAEREVMGVKATAAVQARDELESIDAAVRRAVVAALVPTDPAALWESGPDVAAAAAVWNEAVGRRISIPEDLLTDATKALRIGQWQGPDAVRAVLDPAGEPRLSRDLEFAVNDDRVTPVGPHAIGFTGSTLTAVLPTLVWLAHRLPAGDPIRAALPAALDALRARLAHPGFVIDLGRYMQLSAFRKVAGTPTEVGAGFERYGAVIMSTSRDWSAPGIQVALLDSAGQDPYLPALRAEGQEPFPIEGALRVARGESLPTVLADPGDPEAGERFADGTWWPQDPSQSVPDVVAEVASRFGLDADAATLYLMLLAMPDPTDRMVKRWTRWRPARFTAAVQALAATDLVVKATRSRAGRHLFLPGGWAERGAPQLPIEQWKLTRLGDGLSDGVLTGCPVLPLEPVADLYRRAWQHVSADDGPRFDELTTLRGSRRRR